MKVYIIRHGESECNRQNMNCGWSQTPLSPLGREQAAAAAKYLTGIRFDKVFCSDLNRARETCALALPGYESVLTDKIREISVGCISEHYYEDNLREYGETYTESVINQDFRAFGGESKEQMAARVADFIREVEAQDGQCERIAVVGHEGTVHQFFNHAMGYPVLLEHLSIANASVTVFDYSDGRWSLVAFSYRGALE